MTAVGERYSAAIESSNLRVKAEEKGDVDLLIAAGWAPDTLGAMLYRLATEFDTVRADVRRGALSPVERFLILGRLKSLPAARDEIGIWACIEATRQRFMQPDSAVRVLVGRVIDVHLDPTCHVCEGRGFNGGGRHEHTGPQIICRACRGSGLRRDSVGKTEEERRFARFLLAEMAMRMQSVESMMRKYLRQL